LEQDILAAQPLKLETVSTLKNRLNSERIEFCFGGYGVEQISNCKDIFPDNRISSLYSTHGKDKIVRTLAIVEFENPINQALVPVHHAILSGGSIGTELRKAGWTIRNEQPILGS
jgi:hypothetical protein